MWSTLVTLFAGPLVKEAKEEPNPLRRRYVGVNDHVGDSESPIDPELVRRRAKRIVSYNLQDYESHFALATAIVTAKKSWKSKSLRKPGQTHRPLTKDERDSFKNDKGPVWRKIWLQPWPMIQLILLCGLGAMVQGWDEAAVNSAQVYYTPAYNLKQDDPRIALINGAPYACCVISCWLSWPLNKFLGRRWTIFLSGLCSIAFALGQSFANDWQTMLILRIFLGLGIGPKSVTIPIYASEVAPANLRGALVMSWQLFTALGIMFGYLSGVWFADKGDGNATLSFSLPDNPCSGGQNYDLLPLRCSLGWRLMIGSPGIAPVLLCLYIFVQPESPRWLIAKAQRKERFNIRVEKRNQQRSMRRQKPTEELPLQKIDLEPIFLSFVRLRGGNKIKAARDMIIQDVLLWVQKIGDDSVISSKSLLSGIDKANTGGNGVLVNPGVADGHIEDVSREGRPNELPRTDSGASDVSNAEPNIDTSDSGSDSSDTEDESLVPLSKKRNNIERAAKEIKILFQRRRNRNALFASLIVMAMQQFCGINVLIYYSTRVLFQTGPQGAPILLNGIPKFIVLSSVVGAINFIAGIPAIFVIDKRGRRQLLLRTFPLLAACSALVAIGSRGDMSQNAAREPLILAGMYLFVVFYSYGEGPVPFVYASESFPQDIRDLGMAVVTSINWALNFTVAASFVSMSNEFHMGLSGTFAFYAACCVAGFILIYLFVPETCQKELEELDEVFKKNMLSFALSNLKALVPKSVAQILRRSNGARNRNDEESRVDDTCVGQRIPLDRLERSQASVPESQNGILRMRGDTTTSSDRQESTRSTNEL